MAIGAVSSMTGVLQTYRGEIGTAAPHRRHSLAAVLASHAYTKVAAATTWAYTVAVRTQPAVTKAGSDRSMVLNTAMTANPVGLVIAAIAGVVAGLWAFRRQLVSATATFLEFAAGLVRALGLDRPASPKCSDWTVGLSGVLDTCRGQAADVRAKMDDADELGRESDVTPST